MNINPLNLVFLTLTMVYPSHTFSVLALCNASHIVSTLFSLAWCILIYPILHRKGVLYNTKFLRALYFCTNPRNSRKFSAREFSAFFKSFLQVPCFKAWDLYCSKSRKLSACEFPSTCTVKLQKFSLVKITCYTEVHRQKY